MKRALVLMLVLSVALMAAPVNKSMFTGVAIKGYDPVAYFTEGKPVKGKGKYSYKYEDATWRFSSQENLDKFKADPEKFSPQYGGYCAWGMSFDRLVGINPDMWTIVEDKLYLNYSKKIQEQWSKDPKQNIGYANEHWVKRASEEN